MKHYTRIFNIFKKKSLDNFTFFSLKQNIILNILKQFTKTINYFSLFFLKIRKSQNFEKKSRNKIIILVYIFFLPICNFH